MNNNLPGKERRLSGDGTYFYKVLGIEKGWCFVCGNYVVLLLAAPSKTEFSTMHFKFLKQGILKLRNRIDYTVPKLNLYL